MPLVLRKLESNDEDAFLRALTLTSVSDPNFVHYYRTELAFAAFLHILEDAEAGLGLPDGHVPSSLLYGFVDAEIVGRLMLRHSLNDFLRRIGGNIGFVVVPGHRRRGYATEMLRQGLHLATSKGMEKVLVTCDEDNIGFAPNDREVRRRVRGFGVASRGFGREAAVLDIASTTMTSNEQRSASRRSTRRVPKLRASRFRAREPRGTRAGHHDHGAFVAGVEREATRQHENPRRIARAPHAQCHV
jgi:predicted acetyltransferase